MNKNLAGSMPHPLIVLVAAAIGGAFGLLLLTWRYQPPVLPGSEGQIVPEFTIWLFLIMVYTALLAILLVPMWVLFIHLFQRHRHEVGARRPPFRCCSCC